MSDSRTSPSAPRPVSATTAAAPKIHVRGLSKLFTHHGGEVVLAIEDVSFAVADGEFVSVVGPSGCGKSTMLMCLAGLDHPTRGEVLLDGKLIQAPGPDTGIVFQEYALFPWRDVIGNVVYGLEGAGVPRDERRRIAREYLQLVGLQGFEHHYPYQLSGGMRQRVALARALVMDPKVLLMDEPFGALDSLTRRQMQQELVRIVEATRKTVVFITHSISEAVFLSDRVVLLTSRPACVKTEVSVQVPRPRNLYAPACVEIAAQLERLLWEEFQSANPPARG
jgi:ABC-type nitrate/sulfonate/bicarbonate transport system ATPase subunit